jgi:hypothetical protein
MTTSQNCAVSDKGLLPLLDLVAIAITKAELFQIVLDAWMLYEDEGAGVFDWDYDSRDLMRAIEDRMAQFAAARV